MYIGEMQAGLIAQAGYGNLDKIEKLVKEGARLYENKDEMLHAAVKEGRKAKRCQIYG